MWESLRLLGVVLFASASALGAIAGLSTGGWILGNATAAASLCCLALIASTNTCADADGFRASDAHEAAQPVSRRSGPGARLAAAGGKVGLIEQMLDQRRFALLLRPQIAGNLSAEQLPRALADLDQSMSLVPEGNVALQPWPAERPDQATDARPDSAVTHVAALYLDRYPVTNADYFEFVAAGGYEQMTLWDEDVLPALLDFVDRSGRPGPASWIEGRFPSGQDDHPVVGVSWYEAAAYARWVGKRLPSNAEWVKAACWPVGSHGNQPVQRRYPWGDSMEPEMAKLWGSGPGSTVPVTEFTAGASVGGVYQLIGNVWEWTISDFGRSGEPAESLDLPLPMKSLRGGAFDTYFDVQASCHFQSADHPLARKPNIGFRCAVGLCDLVQLAGAATEGSA